MIESAQWHEVMLKRNTDLSQQLERLTEIIHKHLSATYNLNLTSLFYFFPFLH